MNVSGAYSASADATISRAFDEKGRWTWQMNADANFRHDVDHTMLAGETESHENAVNTTTLHDAAYVQYNKDALNVRLSGDIRWRHSTGRMLDFETLDALDYRYGLSARYTPAPAENHPLGGRYDVQPPRLRQRGTEHR